MRAVRGTRLPNPTLLITLALSAGFLACGRKGDPVPRPRIAAQACRAEWVTLRQLQVTLPRADVQGESLVGLQSLRVYHLPLGAGRPTPQDVLSRGEVMLERSRPDLPGPGGTVVLDLERRSRAPGWVVVVAVRVGGAVGQPSPVLPWLHAAVQ